jgi:Leucine-rich repeat (LRR) protein
MLILERLLDLHDKKLWMQDLVIECIFLLLSYIPESYQASVLCRLKHLVSVPLNEMTPNGLLFAIGLQHLSITSEAFSKASSTAFGLKNLFNLESIDEISNGLLHSASKFPKVKRYIYQYTR